MYPLKIRYLYKILTWKDGQAILDILFLKDMCMCLCLYYA